MTQYLDARPLLGALDALRKQALHDPGSHLASPFTRTQSRRISRMRHAGQVHFVTADEICVGWLGRHPAEVFGADWIE